MQPELVISKSASNHIACRLTCRDSLVWQNQAYITEISNVKLGSVRPLALVARSLFLLYWGGMRTSPKSGLA